MQFGFHWLSGQRFLKLVDADGQTDDNGRRTEHIYTISVPCEPNGSGELKLMGFAFYFTFAKSSSVAIINLELNVIQIVSYNSIRGSVSPVRLPKPRY